MNTTKDVYMNLETCLKKHPVAKAPRGFIEALHRDIVSGSLKPGDSLGSECDLAGRYEVSRTTIRTALKLLEEEKLLQVVPRRGIFLTQELSQGKATVKTPSEYMFVRYCNDSLMHEVASGLSDFFKEHNLRLNIIDINLNTDVYLKILNDPPPNVKAIALFPFETPEIKAAIQQAMERGVRIVQLDRCLEEVTAPAVVFDNFSGAFSATRHLLETHNLPVYYFGNSRPDSAFKRYQGWQHAMVDSGFFDYLQYEVAGVDEGNWAEAHPQESFVRKYKQIKEFLAILKGPVAIFASNDYLARLVYSAAEELGRQIGGDIHVVGFDDLDLCTKLKPELSSIAVPRREMGYEAGRLMLAENCPPGVSKVIPVELIIRASSK